MSMTVGDAAIGHAQTLECHIIATVNVELHNEGSHPHNETDEVNNEVLACNDQAASSDVVAHSESSAHNENDSKNVDNRIESHKNIYTSNKNDPTEPGDLFNKSVFNKTDAFNLTVNEDDIDATSISFCSVNLTSCGIDGTLSASLINSLAAEYHQTRQGGDLTLPTELNAALLAEIHKEARLQPCYNEDELASQSHCGVLSCVDGTDSPYCVRQIDPMLSSEDVNRCLSEPRVPFCAKLNKFETEAGTFVTPTEREAVYNMKNTSQCTPSFNLSSARLSLERLPADLAHIYTSKSPEKNPRKMGDESSSKQFSRINVKPMQDSSSQSLSGSNSSEAYIREQWSSRLAGASVVTDESSGHRQRSSSLEDRSVPRSDRSSRRSGLPATVFDLSVKPFSRFSIGKGKRASRYSSLQSATDDQSTNCEASAELSDSNRRYSQSELPADGNLCSSGVVDSTNLQLAVESFGSVIADERNRELADAMESGFSDRLDIDDTVHEILSKTSDVADFLLSAEIKALKSSSFRVSVECFIFVDAHCVLVWGPFHEVLWKVPRGSLIRVQSKNMFKKN